MKTPILTLFFLLFSFTFLNAQDGKLYIIKNTDTISFGSNPIKVILELSNRKVELNNGDRLVYPNNIDLDSIQAISIEYNGTTLRFFDIEQMKASGKYTSSKLQKMTPDYKEQKEKNANMYFSIDTFPFDTESHTESAKLIDKKNYKKVHIIELNYQAISTRIFKPEE